MNRPSTKSGKPAESTKSNRRFKTLSRILSSDSDQQAVTDESIRDTLLDLANYSIMTVLEIDDAQHEQEIAEQKTCDEGASNAD